MTVSNIMKEISAILTEAKIDHYIDPQIKRFDGNKPYFGIYRSPKRLFFTHSFERGLVQAITPKKLTPKKIERIYGINGKGDIWNKNYGSKTHYVLDIPIKNEKLNGKYKVDSKKTFFIDLALAR